MTTEYMPIIPTENTTKSRRVNKFVTNGWGLGTDIDDDIRVKAEFAHITGNKTPGMYWVLVYLNNDDIQVALSIFSTEEELIQAMRKIKPISHWVQLHVYMIKDTPNDADNPPIIGTKKT